MDTIESSWLTAEQRTIINNAETELSVSGCGAGLTEARGRVIALFESTTDHYVQTFIAIALTQHYQLHSMMEASEQWLENARRSAAADRFLHAWVVCTHATMLMNLHKPLEALDVLESINAKEYETHRSLFVRIINIKAKILDNAGRSLEADETYLLAIGASEEIGRNKLNFMVYHGYADFCYRHEEYGTALEYLIKAFNSAVEINFNMGQSQTMARQALVHARIGEADTAIKKYNHALSLAWAGNVPGATSFVLATGLEMYDVLCNMEELKRTLQQANEHLQIHPSESYRGAVQGFQAIVLADSKDYTGAEAYFHKAIIAYKESKYIVGYGSWLSKLGIMLAEKHDYQRAISVLYEARECMAPYFVTSIMTQTIQMLAKSLVANHAPLAEIKQLLIWSNAYSRRYSDFVKNHITLITQLRHNEQRKNQEEIFQLRHIELKETNERLTAAVNDLTQLTAEKDEMLSIATHDLQNPLASLRSMLSFMTTRTAGIPGNTDVLEDIQAMGNIVNRMEGIVRTFLDFGRKLGQTPALLIDTIDVATLVRKATDRHTALIKSKEHTITTNIHGDTWAIGNVTLFNAIVDNLISNAVKHSPPGGTISISVQHTPTESVRDSDSPDDPGSQWIDVVIADQGPGIPANEASMLFTRQNNTPGTLTAEHSGSGLSLYLSQRMAARMMSKLEYKPSIPHGATFTLRMKPAILS